MKNNSYCGFFLDFYSEATESLQRGFEEKISCENLITEINCYKHAYNVSIDDVNTYVTKSILALPGILNQVQTLLVDVSISLLLSIAVRLLNLLCVCVTGTPSWQSSLFERIETDSAVLRSPVPQLH